MRGNPVKSSYTSQSTQLKPNAEIAPRCCLCITFQLTFKVAISPFKVDSSISITTFCGALLGSATFVMDIQKAVKVTAFTTLFYPDEKLPSGCHMIVDQIQRCSATNVQFNPREIHKSLYCFKIIITASEANIIRHDSRQKSSTTVECFIILHHDLLPHVETISWGDARPSNPSSCTGATLKR